MNIIECVFGRFPTDNFEVAVLENGNLGDVADVSLLPFVAQPVRLAHSDDFTLEYFAHDVDTSEILNTESRALVFSSSTN